MFIVFDTETTGLPKNYDAPVSDVDNWPRVVQVAWQLHDVHGQLLHHDSIIVRPDGFDIPFKAEQVHGISTARALEEGKDVREVLEAFSSFVEKSTYLCGHNIKFDINVLGAEFIRAGLPDVFAGKLVLDSINDDTTNFCAIPGGRGGRYKWPSLGELHLKLFDKGFDQAHNAAFDVAATADCFFELLKRKIMKVKEANEEVIASIRYQAPDLSALLAHELKLQEKKKTASESVAPKVENPVSPTSGTASTVAFSHLHCHSQYSVLQSTSDIDELVKKAGAYNSPGLAITDHGNMYSAFLFWQSVDKFNKGIKAHNTEIKEGKKTGDLKQELKCIFGCELFVTKDRKDRSRQDNGFHQVLLAKNKEGYQNLSKLSSIGFIEGFYYVPRIDKEVLQQYTGNLIATTGSLNGEIPWLILNVGEQQAEEAFVWWHTLFGDDFYVELNRHKLPEEDHVNTVLLKFARKYGVKYFAANTNYYIDRKGAKAHDILLCVKEGELVRTPIGKGRGFRFGFPNDEYYFKSPQEMAEAFSDLPEALECTQEIVNKIQPFKLGRDVLLPKFDISADFLLSHQEEIAASFERICKTKEKSWQEKQLSDNEIEQQKFEVRNIAEQFVYLVHITYIGAYKRYPDMSPEIKERIDFELATIERMGYPGYFLIVSDFTSKAREMGVSVGPGRGSAAGSAIAYALGITNVDPIKYDLLFERFLNPDRISMPDIDIDFDDEGREKVIKYVIDKYGANQVAQIITYGTMGGKSAIRDTARVLDLPLPEADKLAKAFPDSLDASLKYLLSPGGISEKFLEKIKDKREVIDQSHQFRKLSEDKNLQGEVLNQAFELEGSVRNTGIHACGVIITPDELSKFVPVTRGKDSDMLVTQFDNSVAENAGLLKMDFLGLKTLTIIKYALKYIKQRHNLDIDIDAIPFDDKKTYELFQRGETNGIFQFESPGMQKHLKDLKPDVFTDLIAMNALYRPGPIAYIPSYIKRKFGKEPVTYDLEGMEEYLSETYGITVYQEQVMRLSQKLANFTKGDADTLRKAMGKKQKDTLDKMKKSFMAGCEKNGHNLKVADKVWTDWEAFASYAFNKSHSTCYAYLAYQTAYLKAHYPAEYMASTLTHNMNDLKSVTFFMEECKRLNIPVLGPDVNESQGDFSVNEKGEVRFGLAAIKGVGENVVEGIVNERSANGQFESIFDLARRLDSKTMNKKSLEALSQAGAFDSFKGIHRAMFFVPDKDGATLTEKIIKYANSVRGQADSSVVSLFEDDAAASVSEPALPAVEPWGQLEQLGKEKDVVGIYISGHPLDAFRLEINHFCKNSLTELSDLKAVLGRELSVAGIVTSIQQRTSKTGNPFGTFVLEDYSGSYEFALFGKDFIEHNKFLVPNLFLAIRGKVQNRFNSPDNFEFKIMKIQLLSELKEKAFSLLKLKLNMEDVNENFMQQCEHLFRQFPGKSNVEFYISDPDSHSMVKLLSRNIKVTISNDLVNDLEKMNGLSYELV